MDYKCTISLLLLLLYVLLLTGCVKPTGNNYPLYMGEVKASIKLPGTAGDSLTLGDLYITNKGDNPITLTEISLLNPKDMSIIEASLAEIDSNERCLVGDVEWPLKEPSTHWDSRVPVVGATMGPGEGRNLVVVVTSNSSEVASTDAIVITYEDSNGKQYKQQSLTRYSISSVKSIFVCKFPRRHLDKRCSFCKHQLRAFMPRKVVDSEGRHGRLIVPGITFTVMPLMPIYMPAEARSQ